MFVESTTITGGCGVGVLYNFGVVGGWCNKSVKDLVNPGGACWVCAGFISNDEVCNRVFAEMKERWGEPVFITPVRNNDNSGNPFYFAVFDTINDPNGYGFDAEEDEE